MTFDTSTLQQKPFKEALEKLEGLLSHSKAVLLGAGASCCAGLPLTNQLTVNVLASDKLSDDSKEILTAIQASFVDANPAAHIEDFLSELVDWLAIANRRASRAVPDIAVTIGTETYTEKQLATAIDEIKFAIEEQINQKVDSSIHERFVQALHRPMRPGKATQGECIDYLVMNYDALIEDALALSKVHYADGLAGGVSAWWEPLTFDAKGLDAKVYKLHGSIDWVETSGSTVPHRIASHLERSAETTSKIMIWPASTKYREAQLDPYAHLMAKARAVLNPNNGEQRVLLIVGYSFGDAHINLEIERGLKAGRFNSEVHNV